MVHSFFFSTFFFLNHTKHTGGDSGSNGRSTSCVVYIFVLNVNENPATHDQVGGVGNTNDNEFILALPIKNGDSVGPGKKTIF